MQVEAKNFHPMRGHVEDGMQVVFKDGSILTVRCSGVVGWALFNKLGDRVTETTNDAFTLTRQIVELEAA